MKRLFLFFFAAFTYSPDIHPGMREAEWTWNDPGRGAIVFNEVMFDPLPVLGLPGYEYIELYNRSVNILNLGGWTLRAGNRTLAIPDHSIAPGDYLLVCYQGTVDLYPGDGSSLDILNSRTIMLNEGGLLLLLDPDSLLVDWMEYTPDMHAAEYFARGGWSLERIDPYRPCHSFQNWTSSVDREGGTPGRENSVRRSNPDLEPPELRSVYLPDSQNLVIEFTETVDPTGSMTEDAWFIDGGMGSPDSLVPEPSFYREFRLKYTKPFSPGREYHLEIRGCIQDCSGNRMETGRMIRFARPVQPGYHDILISEVLFDPQPFCPDYIELFNSGPMTFDLADLRLAERDPRSWEIESVERIMEGHRLFFPGQYLVLTADPESLRGFYYVEDPGSLVKSGGMPAMGDVEGSVLVLDKYLNILDELDYHSDMHHPMLSSTEGVALERISFGAGNEGPIWHSASASEGYGTPGRRNSQHVDALPPEEGFSVEPEVFTPGMDGKHDMLLIRYRFREGGLKARVLVLDPRGRIVKEIAGGVLLGTEGFFTWDGTDRYEKRAPAGMYLVHAEVYGTGGRALRFRKICVLSKGR